MYEVIMSKFVMAVKFCYQLSEQKMSFLELGSNCHLPSNFENNIKNHRN